MSDEYEARRWNAALDRDAERNRQYGRQEAQAEIDRLRAEVERKDQRIEELEVVLGTIRDAANIHLGSKQ